MHLILSSDLTWPPHWRVMRIYVCEVLAVCHHPDKFYYYKYLYDGDFLICHVTSGEHILKRVMWICGWKPLTVSHQLAMFGGQWSIANRDVKYLIYHVTSQKYVTEGSSNFMAGSSSWYVATLPSLVAIGIAVVGMFLVCHMIKQDHVIKGSGNYSDTAPSR